MATLKSINEVLPRFDTLRRSYMIHGTTGFVDGRRYIDAAFADLTDSGGCDNIAIYATGDAMVRRHYYAEGRSDVVDITEIIEDAIAPYNSSYSEPGTYTINPRHFRAWIVKRIQEAIANQN